MVRVLVPVSYFHVSGPAVPLVEFCACTVAAPITIAKTAINTVVILFLMIVLCIK